MEQRRVHPRRGWASRRPAAATTVAAAVIGAANILGARRQRQICRRRQGRAGFTSTYTSSGGRQTYTSVTAKRDAAAPGTLLATGDSNAKAQIDMPTASRALIASRLSNRLAHQQDTTDELVKSGASRHQLIRFTGAAEYRPRSDHAAFEASAKQPARGHPRGLITDCYWIPNPRGRRSRCPASSGRLRIAG